MEYTSGVVSPDVMRLWTGLSMLAAAVGRRVHSRIQTQNLYPNMYVLLIGPPGVGKSNASAKGHEIIARIPSIKLAPDGISKRAFFAELERAQVAANVEVAGVLPGLHAALYAQVEEMGVFVNPLDKDFMVALARLYDCRPTFDYKTQHVGEHHIENAVVNLLGCCTRAYLADAWSHQVLEQGFPARIIMVYSEELVGREVFEEGEPLDGRPPAEEALFQALVHDMEIISRLSGRFIWTTEAKKVLIDWHKGGMEPRPNDLRLQHYCNRRLAHLCKITMIASVSTSDELVVGAEEVVAAREILLQVEQTMPGALEILGANPYANEMEMAIKAVTLEYRKMRGKKGVAEYKLRQYLYKEVPPQFISAIIQGIILSNRVTAMGEPGRYIFFPIGAGEGAEEAESPQDGEGE